MIVTFYFIVSVFAVVMMASFLVRNSKVDSLFILFSFFVALNCVGRYLLAISESLEMALLANKILYIGACYTPPLALFVLARLCEHKLPSVLKVFLITYSSVVLGFVMTIGKGKYYYAEVSLLHGNGFNYLHKTYGPFHILYPVMMILYAIIMLAYLGYAIRKRHQLSFRLVVTLSGSCLAIMLMYIVERLLKLNVSFLSIGYLIGIALLINYFDRVNIYDMSSNIVRAMEKISEYGYLVLDQKYRYVNSNAYIKAVFPEIREWIVDREIPESDSFLYREVIQYLLQWDEQNQGRKTITVNDQYYDIEIRVLSHGRKPKVGYLIEFMDRTIENRYYKTIKDYNLRLEKEVEEKTADIMMIKDMMVLGMADMVESRDNNTGGHIKRTSAVVRVFADSLGENYEQLGLSRDLLKIIRKAAPMHDLGKIAIDDQILRKPGKFTPQEFEQMKKHAEEGARIVNNILRGVEDDYFVQIAVNIAHYHHEKWDGTGYPCGLSGEAIPIEARIMALADVFDALVSKRCYKEAFSYDEAFRIIEESLGQHFDPNLGKLFLECRTKLENIYDSYV